MPQMEDMIQKMMRSCDATNDNVRALWNDLYGIVQKVYANALCIKHIEQQVTQLSAIVNPCQYGTLLRNTIHNLKNNGHFMTVTTWGVGGGAKQTMDPPMPSEVEIDTSRDDNMVKKVRNPKNATEKEVVVTDKLVPFPRTPPPFPQRLAKKNKEGKYHRFITMLK